MKPLRYTGRYWRKDELDKAKFRGAAISRWLNENEPVFKLNVTHMMRLRLTARTLPKRTK